MTQKWSPLVTAPTPEQAEFLELVGQLNVESDRGATLIVTSFLEELLGQLLGAHFRDEKIAKDLLDRFGAPLGTFSARIKAAYALGLIGPGEMRTIDLMREIRNAFAHRVKASFADKGINAKCAELGFAFKEGVTVSIEPRMRFEMAGATLILRLTSRVPQVAASRAAIIDWDFR